MKIIVVKMGGVAATQLNEKFFQKIRLWKASGYQVVIVHGGGKYISEMMDQLGQKVEIKNGLRVTSKEALAITRMVLIGQVQPNILTAFQNAGLPAIGTNAGCDQLISGELIDSKKLGLVGKATHINVSLLQTLLVKNYIPVVAPLGITADGQWLNINADEVACQLAAALKAEKLYLLTDVSGIKRSGNYLKEVPFNEIENLKRDKVVTGGMLPKIDSAKKALIAGVSSVFITNNLDTGTELKVAAS